MPEPIRAEQIIGNFTHVEPWREVGSADNPSFESSWVNFGSVYNTAAFYKDMQGVVHLKGLVKNGTVGSAETVFTLPEGYRPPARYLFDAVSESGGSVIQSRIDIGTDGRIIPVVGGNTFLSLDSIAFRLE